MRPFKNVTRLQVLKSVYAGISIVISALYFILTLEAVFRFIRVRSGLTSWVGLMSLLVLGIGELSFVLLTGELYRKLTNSREVFRKFLRIAGIFGWMFAALKVFQIWTYIPKIANWFEYARGNSLLSGLDLTIFYIGISIGIGVPIYLALSARRNKDESK